MVTTAHLHTIRSAATQARLPKSAKLFVYGSSTRERAYRDIDVGVVGLGDEKTGIISRFSEALYDAPLAYRVDVVNYDTAERDFVDYVDTHEKKVWIP